MTYRIRITSIFMAAASVTLAFYAVAAHAQALPAGTVANGKKLYDAYSCYACHGFNGETGARPLVPNRSANLATEASFIAFLRARANVAPVQPSTSMPNYSADTLSDAQAKDIYAHIRTFKSNAPPVDQIPVLKQILSGAQKPYKP